MRHAPFATLLTLLALGVAGCGGSGDAAPADSAPAVPWTGPAELRPLGGELDVARFREHAAGVDADWERDPGQLAREFLRVEDGTVSGEDELVLLRDSLEDDSVRAERWVLALERDGERWALVSARWEQRCHEGRGHQDFRAELCV